MQKQLISISLPSSHQWDESRLLKMLSSATSVAGNEGLPTLESHCYRGRKTPQRGKGRALSNHYRVPLPLLPQHFETLMASLLDVIEESQLIKGYWQELLQTIAVQPGPSIATRQWLAAGNPAVMHSLAHLEQFLLSNCHQEGHGKRVPKTTISQFYESWRDTKFPWETTQLLSHALIP